MTLFMTSLKGCEKVSTDVIPDPLSLPFKSSDYHYHYSFPKCSDYHFHYFPQKVVH